MTSVAPTTTTFQVDREQSSLRFVIPGIFVGGGILLYFILNLLVASSGLNIIAVLGALIGAAGISYFAEKFLKPRWPSSRVLEMDAEGMRLAKNGQLQVAIGAGDVPQQLKWRFEINKRARIPKGWWMLAYGLETEDRMLVVYTFVSPGHLAASALADDFTVLTGKKARDKSAAAGATLRAAGEDRRLRAAEEVRWVAGAEMTFEEFQAVLALKDKLFPEWEPIS